MIVRPAFFGVYGPTVVGVPPSFPANSVLDNFNRADEGPPPSTSWAGPVFTADVEFRVSSNVAAMVGGPASSYWNTSLNADQEAHMKLAGAAGAGQDLLLRIANPNSANVSGIAVNIYTPFGGVRIFDVTDGNYSQLDATIPRTFTDGDSIGATVIGTTVTIYYKIGAGDWASIGTRTTSITGSGYIGMRGESGVAIDDFGGGNI